MYPTNEFPVFGVFVKNLEILLEKRGVEIISKSYIKGRRSSIKKFLAYVKFYISIIKSFFTRNIDFYYIHFPLQSSLIINFLLLFFNKKIILNIHGSELSEKSFFYNSFLKLLKKVDLIIVPSSFYKNLLCKSFQIIDAKIFVYPSGGVNQAVFKPLNKSDLRTKYKLDNNFFICSYISSIIKEKGWETFYLASQILIEKNTNIHFVVVGNGADERIFKAKVSNNNLTSYYTFFDRAEQSVLPEFFNLSDLFIFPTHKESLGLVGLEALSCGIPVLASHIGATQQYIEEGKNGYLFELKNEKELAEKINIVWKKDNLKLLKENALLSSIKFESEFCTNLLLEKLKEI